MALTILVAVLLTSTLSGVLGMGGGILLMGVYAALLPGPAAMVLHGVTQLASNGSRALLLREHVQWPIVARYLIGLGLASMVMAAIGLLVDRRVILIGLGLLALAGALLPRERLELDLSRTLPVAAGGLVAGTVQLLAGVAGPVLDALFARSTLGRHAVVGTKAAVQVSSHAIKVLYFVVLAGEASWDAALSPWLVPAVIFAAMLGTRLGRKLLDRLGEASFRRYADRLLLAIGLLFLARGLLACA